MTNDPHDLEVDPVDQAEQRTPVDPGDDEVEPQGGPDLVDEADWIDQRLDAAQDEEGGPDSVS